MYNAKAEVAGISFFFFNASHYTGESSSLVVLGERKGGERGCFVRGTGVRHNGSHGAGRGQRGPEHRGQHICPVAGLVAGVEQAVL